MASRNTLSQFRQPVAMGSPQSDQPCSNCDAVAEPATGNYFVSTYPPFSTWTKEAVSLALARLDDPRDSSPETPLGLYVHVPFCPKRCDYCYYLSYADKTTSQMADYVELVLKEAALHATSPAIKHRQVSFVYFGGGTPSFLPNELIQRLTQGLTRIFDWKNVNEITFECAPKTVTRAKLQILRDAGVSRISMGVQSFDDSILRQNGRMHLQEDILRAFELLRQLEFDIINIDLIVGLPGSSSASTQRDISHAIDLAPESVTVYQLEIPLNTPLYRSMSVDEVAPESSSWEVKRQHLHFCFARLEEAGYTIRSAYAAVRDPTKHRFAYQDEQYGGADLLGLGLASFSYVDGTHFQNRTSFAKYGEDLRCGKRPIERAYLLGDEERMIREFVLQLKLGRVDSAYFRKKFGVDIAERFARTIEHCARHGWLSYDGCCVQLTRDGLLQFDRLIPMFYLPKHKHLRYS